TIIEFGDGLQLRTAEVDRQPKSYVDDGDLRGSVPVYRFKPFTDRALRRAVTSCLQASRPRVAPSIPTSWWVIKSRALHLSDRALSRSTRQGTGRSLSGRQRY